MKNKITIYSLIAAVPLVLVYLLFFKSSSSSEKFTFTQIKKGNIISTITSTGTVDPVTSVDVGTQVSGKIAKIFVDYNTFVRKGQLLAIIDTTALSLNVKNAKANLLKAQSQFDLAKTQYKQNQKLFSKGFLSDLDFATSKSALETDSADVISAKLALKTAETNLGYAYIYSPITGTVTNKNVLEGNTVAASLQSPVLFSIAQDLSKMQILASVDESDIGQIKMGQTTDFTVEAYPDKKFMGKVVQIRLNSQVVSNVVEYTVVINADNKDELLLPGMTATVDFYVAQRDSVLMIPNDALGFRPDQQMLAKYKLTMQKTVGDSGGASSSRQNNWRQAGRSFNSNDSAKKKFQNVNVGKIWTLDNNGNLKQNFVLLGLTDGKNTEILRSRNLKEGTEIITGTESSAKKSDPRASGGFPRGMGRGL